MIRIVTADGQVARTAYANAYAADVRMEGVRVSLTVGGDGDIEARVHPDDMPAMTAWSEEDCEAMLRGMASLAADNDIDMCDDREVNAWITTN